MALGLGTAGSAAGCRPRSPVVDRLAGLFLGRATIVQVLLMAGLPVLVCVWLLIAPERVFSRTMTADLLFNLTGAWNLHNGLVPHVDYHDPVGVLSLLLTELGFRIVGPRPHAMLVGELIFLAFAFTLALVAARSRLPSLAATIFVLYTALLVLLPTNIGDQPHLYSFAMSYNRWSWCLLTTLCLILFLPPRAEPHGVARDVSSTILLLAAMFYLKITFFAAGMIALALAVVLMPHIRRDMRWWIAGLVLLTAGVLAPFNHAYLSDLWYASRSGYARLLMGDLVRNFLVNKAEYAIYVSSVALLLWLWRCGRSPWQAAAAGGFLVGLCMLVVSQNSLQVGTVPVGVVILMMVYMAARPAEGQAAPVTATVPRLLATLVLPAISIAGMVASLVGYYAWARSGTGLLTVGQTNLRGLAVPAAAIESYHLSLNGRMTVGMQPDNAEAVDIEALLEAASLFADGRHGRPRLMIADQLNPLPFIVGFPPPRGANLWSFPGAPDRSAETIYGDVDYVLVPKFVVVHIAKPAARAVYDRYLADNFVAVQETRYWSVLARRHPQMPMATGISDP